MPNPTYKQSDLSAAIWDSKIEQNASSQIDQQNVMNSAVRDVSVLLRPPRRRQFVLSCRRSGIKEMANSSTYEGSNPFLTSVLMSIMVLDGGTRERTETNPTNQRILRRVGSEAAGEFRTLKTGIIAQCSNAY
jgi:hypothetical protein